MAEHEHFVIVGASLAGTKAAEKLRAGGFDGALTLLGSESLRPYERPPLSKDLLQGKSGRAAVFLHGREWYERNEVNVRRGTTAVALDLREHRLTLAAGESLGYDRLLLATGATPRLFETQGDDLDGVYYLRTLGDSEALSTVLSGGGRRVVVIGSGWIGLEIAASAKVLGNEVTVLMNRDVPLVKALGRELGAVFAQLHRDNGVDLRTSVEVTGLVSGDGRVTGVSVRDGSLAPDDAPTDSPVHVPADLVIVAIGVTPNVRIAHAAGLDVDDGILVDARLATSDPDVFAAGDVANVLHPVLGERIRSEHWQVAIWTGEHAAGSMLGGTTVYDRIPYFFTDQFDLGMEYSGYSSLARDATVVYRGDRSSREFLAFWVTSEERVVAGMNVNVWDVHDQVQRLVRDARPVDRARLSNPEVPLDSL